MHDLRPIYYSEARSRLIGNRLAVYDQLYNHGPCTAKELASSMQWEVTSVRPRLTELREIHHVAETGDRRNGEHVFRALTASEAEYLIAAEHETQAKTSASQAEKHYQQTNQRELFAV